MDGITVCVGDKNQHHHSGADQKARGEKKGTEAEEVVPEGLPYWLYGESAAAAEDRIWRRPIHWERREGIVLDQGKDM